MEFGFESKPFNLGVCGVPGSSWEWEVTGERLLGPVSIR